MPPPACLLAFTRYCYYQYCKVYGIQKGGRGEGRILLNSRATVLQQCGQCRRARGMKRRLIRAQRPKSKEYLVKADSLAGSRANPNPSERWGRRRRINRSHTHTTTTTSHNTRHDKNNTTNDHTRNHPPALNTDRREYEWVLVLVSTNGQQRVPRHTPPPPLPRSLGV